MSSKPSKTKHRLSADRSRIFFRNPVLLKIVAWLGSLSVIGNTGVVWADLKPISATQTESQALIQASVSTDNSKVELQNREVFGPYLPNNPNHREVPISIDPGSAAVSSTGKITLPQPGNSTAGDYSIKVNGSEVSIEIPVPPPLQATIPKHRQVAAKSKNPAQNPIGNSTPKTGINVATSPRARYDLPSPSGLNSSVPKATKEYLKAAIVVPMKPSTIAKSSSTPIVASVELQSETSVEIPVPAPLSRIIKVQPVAQLPQVTSSGKVVPIVPPLPSVNASTTAAPSKRLALANNPSNEQGVELVYPLSNPAPITSPFGWRTHPITGSRRFHAGVDIGAPMGAPVVAAGSGTIVTAGWASGYGKSITIQHNGVQQTLYGHLSEIFVQPGQTIEAGTVIGRVGSTGNSTGPHLHFESRMSTSDGWIAVDPGEDVKYALANLRREIDVARKDLSPKIN
jgi:murein DD-endopeptidase MepM/ murein hydrolase activator NlpD